MEKRPFVWMFLACAAGILAGHTSLPVLLLPGLGVSGLLLYKKRKLRYLVLAIVTVFVVGFLREYGHDARLRGLQERLCRQENTDKLKIQGLIIQTKEGEKSYQYRVHHCRVLAGTTVLSIPDIILYQSKQNSVIPKGEGTFVQAEGCLRFPERARNDGGFDERKYDYGAGIFASMFPERVEEEKAPGRSVCLEMEAAVYRFAWRIKSDCRLFYNNVLGTKEAGMVSAVCLGTKEAVGASMEETFRATGISHVLAISGVHISIIGFMVLSLLGKGNFSLNIQFIIGFLAVLLFAIGTGGTGSALRAAIMFGVYLGSVAIGRSYDGLSAMALAGLILLFWEPNQLYSLSFQFSFAAVTGVFGAKEWILHKYRTLHPLLQTLIISGTLYLVTLPLIWWYQWQVALYSLLLNLVVIPLVTPLLGFGLVGGVLGILEVPVISNFLVHFSGGAAFLIAWLAEHYLCLPGSCIVIGHPPLWELWLYLVALVMAYMISYYRKNFMIILGMVVFIPAAALIPHQNRNQVTFLDVGQGDGIVMETKEGSTFVVDGGSSDEKEVGIHILKPFLTYHGKKRVDVWFVSHLDEDHVSGLLELMEKKYPIGRLCFLDTVEADPRFRQVCQLAGKRKIPISFLKDGQQFVLGQLQITVLGRKSEDVNDSSLALLVRFPKEKKAFWLGGDMSMEVEGQLIDEIKGIRDEKDTLIMKANHHGSNGSNSTELIETLHPQGIVISCGKHNRYGHPGKEATARMKKAGIPYVVTMDSGQVRLGCD
ncbi:MAG: DNA internalization-related competence protein ComEC/Rec2 [Lachnospiraceae bacterium]|nr:DNA internalization-related competence protein ComEC/Rec2 [Lachnospiraceae bacterium]